LLVTGTPGQTDRLALEWGRLRKSRIEILRSDPVSRIFAVEAGSILPWRFVVAGELPPPMRSASVVRVTFQSDVSPGPAIAATAPVTYASEKLAVALEGGTSRTLVHPRLLTYLPCVELPRLADGVVQAPNQILVARNDPSPVAFPRSSPFLGVLDLYRLERLPVADSTNPPTSLVVFRVDQRIPGAMRASPVRRSLTS
jgi:hypothetical protein